MRHPQTPPLLAALLAALALPAAGTAAREQEGGRGAEARGQPPHERGRPDRPPLTWEQEAERRVTPRERQPPGAARERDGRGPSTAGRPDLPPPGQRVQRLPPGAQHAQHGSDPYWFADGVWYAPRIGGYAVVRPPAGLVVAELPVFRTIVRVGGLTLYLVNGVYYRPLAQGGYLVVEPPAAPAGPPGPRPTVLPRQGQGPQQQARDEYECHRWATGQSGYDPSLPGSGTLAQRHDYRYAQAACLEARGYTVR